MAILPAPTIPTRAENQLPRTVPDWCFLLCWLIAAAATAGWVFVMVPMWAGKEEMNDRFLIPCASAAIFWLSRPRLRSAPPSPVDFGIIPLVLGAAGFALGWYVAVQVSSRPIVVWWQTGSLISLLFGLVLVHLGWKHAKEILFPLLFILFALPTPGRVYNPLMLKLKEFTTATAQSVLPLLGVPVERPDPNSFELKLASGDLGIVEACSGVRSTIPLTAIAVLVAYWRRFSIMRSILLLMLTVPVIAVANAIRVIITGLLQEFVGVGAISGWNHEALGILAVLIGLVLIIGISSLIAPRQPTKETPPGPPTSLSQSGSGAFCRASCCLTVLLSGLAACAWSEQFRIDHRVAVKLNELPHLIGFWTGEDRDTPEVIIDELKADQIVHRTYQNPQGQMIELYVMFWGSAAATASQHHPDICMPFRGWERRSSEMKTIELTGGRELPVSMRHYVKPEQQQILFFWTQAGSHVMPEGVERPELMSGHSWVIDLLKHGHQPIDAGARLSVLMGASTRGSVEPGERLLREFTQEFATGLYDLCPWARPVK